MVTERATKAKTGRKRGNNEGSIYQREDGRWCAQVTLADGKRKYLYGKTRTEVAKKLTEIQRTLDQGLPVTSGRQQTLGQFLDGWLCNVVKPTHARGTYRGYEQLARCHIKPTLGKVRLDQVTPPAIQSLLNAKRAEGLSSRTVQYMHAVLRVALGQALDWNLVARNAALGAKPPRVEQKEIEALTHADAQAILSAFAGHPLDSLVNTTLAMGLRQGEALALRWSDVNLDTATLEVRNQVHRVSGDWKFKDLKTKGSRRTLPLPRFVVAALRDQRLRVLEQRLLAGDNWADLDLVFPNPNGEPRNGTRVTHTFQDKLATAGLARMRFHDLRHGTASLLLAKGLSLKEIQAILGHSTITITANLYTHVAPELKRRAAEHMDALLGVG